jgi:hypothetical protein
VGAQNTSSAWTDVSKDTPRSQAARETTDVIGRETIGCSDAREIEPVKGNRARPRPFLLPSNCLAPFASRPQHITGHLFSASNISKRQVGRVFASVADQSEPTESCLHQSLAMSTSNQKVIVVGGGLSGLSAAHTLYERGANVVLLDKVCCGGVACRVRGELLTRKTKPAERLHGRSVTSD